MMLANTTARGSETETDIVVTAQTANQFVSQEIKTQYPQNYAQDYTPGKSLKVKRMANNY